MARPASVFVRDLTPEEAQRLRRTSRQSKVFALRQRAQILLASDAGSSAPEIARVFQTDENQVRRVIRDFNADGLASLRPPIGKSHPPGPTLKPGYPMTPQASRPPASPTARVTESGPKTSSVWEW